VEFVPSFDNFNASNIFHRPRFQPWEKKNPMQEKITPVTNLRQTPTSADENSQPFELIEPFEHQKPHKPHKPPKPLNLDLLLICIKKGKLCKVVGAFRNDFNVLLVFPNPF